MKRCIKHLVEWCSVLQNWKYIYICLSLAHSYQILLFISPKMFSTNFLYFKQSVYLTCLRMSTIFYGSTMKLFWTCFIKIDLLGFGRLLFISLLCCPIIGEFTPVEDTPVEFIVLSLFLEDCFIRAGCLFPNSSKAFYPKFNSSKTKLWLDLSFSFTGFSSSSKITLSKGWWC